ncbi:MAG: molecular chaperone HtpG [Gammaproteobacteria bacterium]|nr:MAG: molecular chaperone HtpG [Gammaproteobacteria bacterium]
MTPDTHKETLGFQTEVRQLLKLMIHSLYSNKEIFLRELISNASDALDKLRFEALTDDALYQGDSELKIRVSYNKDARTVTISDNGIGMSREEVVAHIGTIAKSGTREFFDKLSGDAARDAHLIGQFGVGFYSAFIVADRVTLTTRRAGLGAEHGVRWESSGEGDYSIETIEQPARGTEVTLHLREGEDEFLDGFRLRAIIRKYSDHINAPILLPAEGKDKTGEETVNRASALWARPKNEISAEEYNEFYKHVAHDFENPLAHLHSRVEGKLEYTLLLYIPAHAPFDLWERDSAHGVKLYVRRVFIMEDNKHLLPRYLRFVRGVMDSNDLPLNVSREILQGSKIIDSIRAAATKRILGQLEDMAANEAEKYATFWKEFGRVLKEGVVEDHANREQIAKLLRFASTHHDAEQQTVSLADYVARMKHGQDKIYYITAENFNAAKYSPHLELLRKKGLEVLLMYEPVDEWVVGHLHEFEGKPLQSAAKGELDLGKFSDKEDEEVRKKAESELKGLVERIRSALGDKVAEVRVSQRLTASPACLVSGAHDLGVHLERLLKASGQTVPGGKPALEINPDHPLIKKLDQEAEDARFEDWAHILYDQALLSEGAHLPDPAAFVRRLNNRLLEIGQ